MPVPHVHAVGTHVELWRDGVHQQDAVVHRHDRNGTYRLEHSATKTYVTAYVHELRLPGQLEVAYEVSRHDGTVFYVDTEAHAVRLHELFGMEYSAVNWAGRQVWT